MAVFSSQLAKFLKLSVPESTYHCRYPKASASRVCLSICWIMRTHFSTCDMDLTESQTLSSSNLQVPEIRVGEVCCVCVCSWCVGNWLFSIVYQQTDKWVRWTLRKRLSTELEAASPARSCTTGPRGGAVGGPAVMTEGLVGAGPVTAGGSVTPSLSL